MGFQEMYNGPIGEELEIAHEEDLASKPNIDSDDYDSEKNLDDDYDSITEDPVHTDEEDSIEPDEDDH